MKLRACMIPPVLAIGLATPAWAQQISEQEAYQAAKRVVAAFEKALHEKDAAGAAALFTENAIRVSPDGAKIGRPEIEKAFSETLRVYTPEFDKLDQVAVLGNDTIWSVTSWAGTIDSPKGPVPLKGYATFTYVREGDGWKIRNETFNVTD